MYALRKRRVNGSTKGGQWGAKIDEAIDLPLFFIS
jgi:hypothetical protein